MLNELCYCLVVDDVVLVSGWDVEICDVEVFVFV